MCKSYFEIYWRRDSFAYPMLLTFKKQTQCNGSATSIRKPSGNIQSQSSLNFKVISNLLPVMFISYGMTSKGLQWVSIFTIRCLVRVYDDPRTRIFITWKIVLIFLCDYWQFDDNLYLLYVTISYTIFFHCHCNGAEQVVTGHILSTVGERKCEDKARTEFTEIMNWDKKLFIMHFNGVTSWYFLSLTVLVRPYSPLVG